MVNESYSNIEDIALNGSDLTLTGAQVEELGNDVTYEGEGDLNLLVDEDADLTDIDHGSDDTDLESVLNNIEIEDGQELTLTADQADELTIEEDEDDSESTVNVTALEGETGADLSGIAVDTLNASIDSTDDVNLDGSADLNDASVEVTGTDTLEITGDNNAASYNLAETSTLTGNAEYLTEQTITDEGDGTVEVTALEGATDADLSDINVDTLTAAYDSDDDEDLKANLSTADQLNITGEGTVTVHDDADLNEDLTIDVGEDATLSITADDADTVDSITGDGSAVVTDLDSSDDEDADLSNVAPAAVTLDLGSGNDVDFTGSLGETDITVIGGTEGDNSPSELDITGADDADVEDVQSYTVEEYNTLIMTESQVADLGDGWLSGEGDLNQVSDSTTVDLSNLVRSDLETSEEFTGDLVAGYEDGDGDFQQVITNDGDADDFSLDTLNPKEGLTLKGDLEDAKADSLEGDVVLGFDGGGKKTSEVSLEDDVTIQDLQVEHTYSDGDWSQTFGIDKGNEFHFENFSFDGTDVVSITFHEDGVGSGTITDSSFNDGQTGVYTRGVDDGDTVDITDNYFDVDSLDAGLGGLNSGTHEGTLNITDNTFDAAESTDGEAMGISGAGESGAETVIEDNVFDAGDEESYIGLYDTSGDGDIKIGVDQFEDDDDFFAVFKDGADDFDTDDIDNWDDMEEVNSDNIENDDEFTVEFNDTTDDEIILTGVEEGMDLQELFHTT